MRKREKGEVIGGAVLQRQEVETDAIEIWVVASRLLGRLTESSRPHISRRHDRAAELPAPEKGPRRDPCLFPDRRRRIGHRHRIRCREGFDQPFFQFALDHRLFRRLSWRRRSCGGLVL